MSRSAKRPAVFLDRDGVLSRSEVRDGKPYAPTRLEDFGLLPDAGPALTALKKAGFLLVVVTNQPDVGNGLVDRAEVDRMNDALADTLPVDAIKTCFHAQSAGCTCRKPEPGMLLEAAEELSIDLSGSFMVGDRWNDIEAGRAAGCRTVFIDRHYGERKPANQDFTTDSLDGAARYIREVGAKGARLPINLDAGELIRFVITGGLSAGVYALCLYLLAQRVSPLVASVPAYIVAIFANYALQRCWTFKSTRRHRSAIPRHVTTHLGGICLNMAVLYAFNTRLHWPLVPVQVAAICVVAAWGYLLQKHWVFSSRVAS